MTNDVVALMDERLGACKAGQQITHVYLLNGIKIVGYIRAFDKDTIEITKEPNQSPEIQGTLINRKNLTTVQPPDERNGRR